ncbi:YafY family protein [Niveibacterium sp. SC-1]|uniref:helix-turn-helix transcriptional regulator n=1 Tax=Niveibacterium sp. SC-1 TaxID=3135646 RepID=UPI00311F2FD0
MRRADRLFQLTQILRGRRLTTARHLAERLSVSERTVYRDVRDLSLSGVPIEGEAGVGYRLRPGFDLPPLMFSPDELAALALGARMVHTWAGSGLAAHAQSAQEKIAGALTPALRARFETVPLHSFTFRPSADGTRLETFRKAIDARLRLRLQYRDMNDQDSLREVWPLGLFFSGPAWLLGTWCELRGDFRSFRVDRVQGFEVLDSHYPDQPGRRLPDLMRAYKSES